MMIFGDENIVYLKEVLSNYFDYKSFSGRKLNNLDLEESGCEILITRSQTKITGELLDNTNVKLVATATSGTDHFDTEYLERKGIPYFSAKGSNANSVAEYVVYSILKWAYLKNIDINENTIGIVGFGSIGKIVAAYSAMLGLNVLVNDPPLLDAGFEFPNYVKMLELDELIEKSNILTNHVPLNIGGKYATQNLFNLRNLEKFRENGLIIHASRGSVMDEKALMMVHSEKNAELVIDVWEREPDFNVELAKKCLMATPHIAGYSHNGKLNGTLAMLEVVEKYKNIEIDKTIISNELNKSEKFLINNFLKRSELLESLERTRKFEDDFDKFINICNLEQDAKIQSFDEQRKKYPIRYELLKI